MDNAGLRVPTKRILYFSTFKASNISRLSPSTRRVMAENNICKSLDVFNKHNIPPEDTVSFLNPTVTSLPFTCIVALPIIKF
jgi:hypothetical protein